MGQSTLVEVCSFFVLFHIDKISRLDVVAVTVSRRSLGCDYLRMQNFDRRVQHLAKVYNGSKCETEGRGEWFGVKP